MLVRVHLYLKLRIQFNLINLSFGTQILKDFALALQENVINVVSLRMTPDSPL